MHFNNSHRHWEKQKKKYETTKDVEIFLFIILFNSHNVKDAMCHSQNIT